MECAIRLAVLIVVATALPVTSAQADMRWRWAYTGSRAGASGRLTTTDTADAHGFYEITSIDGSSDGSRITGFQSTGTSIPGNKGYPVDNRIRKKAPQLTEWGFAIALANRTYASPFYGARFARLGYYVFLSDPVSGRTREPFVRFAAEPIGERER
jgi:hypothetical protein